MCNIMKAFLLLCIAAAGAPLLASAQSYCMTGVPCGNGCTMGDGVCINGRCFDSTGSIEWECMAPMRAPTPLWLQSHDTAPPPSWMPRFPTWQPWSFPSFPMFKPWIAFGPIGTFSDCGGKGPCGQGQFCDATGVCRPDDCSNQFKYGCPEDNGELEKMPCPHFSGFKECYASTTGGFRCFRGPSGSSLACATQSGLLSGATWAGAFGYDSARSDNTAGSAQASSSAAATAGAAAPAGSPQVKASNQSAFKKVVTEAGPAAAASPTAAGVTSATAVDKKALLGAAAPSFLKQTVNDANQLPPGAMLGPMRTPDGGSIMAAGRGPGITMTSMTPGGMAGGSAFGSQKSVVVRNGPTGRMAQTSSFSNDGSPAVATSMATSSPSDSEAPSEATGTPNMPTAPAAATSSASAVAVSSDGQQAPTTQQQERQQQGSAVNSREGVMRESPAAADAAKPTSAGAKPGPAAGGAKSSAGSGLRSACLWQVVVAGCLAALLL